MGIRAESMHPMPKAHRAPGRSVARASRPTPSIAFAEIAGEDRQMRRLLTVGFLVLLVPAAVAWMTGWRWRPWPPGPRGYGSISSEARKVADTYVPLGFGGC